MSYIRVLPRDAFNEANLLKCIGQLTLLIHDKKIPLECEYYGGPFSIELDESDGSIWVSNMRFTYKNKVITFHRPMNARAPWPLIEGSTYEDVFDDNGNFILNLEALNCDN